LGAPLRFGVSRGNGGPQLLSGAKEFALALGQSLGAAISLRVAHDYEHLLKSVRAETVELAWMPPLIHVRASSAGGELIAVSERAGRLSYRSVLVVRSDSSVKALSELVGARAAWVDPASASGYLFPRLHLRASGVALETALAEEKFYGSATNACQAVLAGEADLFACFVSTAVSCEEAQLDLQRTFGRRASELRALAVTDLVPPDGIVCAPHVALGARSGLKECLCALHTSAAGQRALRLLLDAERMVAVNPEVEQQLRRLATIA
jgi:phosphate/phosphite/phosphonate ABC transporter binding protein